jgi:hypothetical protein
MTLAERGMASSFKPDRWPLTPRAFQLKEPHPTAPSLTLDVAWGWPSTSLLPVVSTTEL